MVETKARVIVAQKYTEVLDRIRAEVSRRHIVCPNEIFYFDNPNDVFTEVQRSPVHLVITGQVFGSSEGSIGFGSKSSNSGVVLAEHIKRVSPNTLLVRYSFLEGASAPFAGHVNKKGLEDLPLVACLISASDLSDLVRPENQSRLKERFPGVKWYTHSS